MKSLINRQILFIIFNIILLLTEVHSRPDTLDCNIKKSFNAEEGIQYSLTVTQYFKNKYVKFEVKGERSTTNYVLSAYSDSERRNRIQLAQGFNGKTKLYLSKEQNADYISSIYIDLECSEYPCRGEIENSYSDSIELEEGEILNYYVSSTNKRMEFSLTSKEGTKKSNVWARGQLSINTRFSSSSQDKKQNDNYYIANDMMKNARFEVEGTEGDFINVGFIGYKEEHNLAEGNYYLSQTNLVVDENTLTGFLKKGSFEKTCYKMTIREKPYQDTVMYGIGHVLTKFAYAFVANSDGSRFTMSGEELHKKGYIHNFISSDQMESQYLCITFPPANYTENPNYKDLNELVFTYQITQGVTTKSLNIYEPQIRGASYHRIINKNAKVAFIPQTKDDFEIMYWNLLTEYGFPKMTAIECENYPLCDLNNNALFTNAKYPQDINGITSYSYKKNLGGHFSPINKHQKLFVVECKESQKTTEKESKYYDWVCSFDSVIYNEKDKMQLIEDQIYYQFIPKDKTKNYKINLQHESDINKVFIDVILYTGEVIINLDSKDGITSDQYTAVNKIYTSVKITKPSEQLDEMTFSIKATTNSYFTVLFNIGRGQNAEMDSLIKNDLQSGISYLVTIDNSKLDLYGIGHKVIKVKNQRLFDNNPFMVNFYSLNCEVQGHILFNDKNNNLIEKPLYKQFGSYIHDVVNPTDDYYSSGIYEYRLNVLQNDYSDYNGKLCKVFFSGIELGTEHDLHTRDILIPDNIPQQVMFGNKITHVSYGYVHVNHHNDLIIKFNPYHKALYIIKLYFNGVEGKERVEKIAAKDVIYLTPNQWSDSCNDTISICYVQLDITLEDASAHSKEECFLEVSIKSIGSQTVTYIPKNNMKIDYVQNSNSQFYYTELGSNENGFISLNFLRGSGIVYSRIVSKNVTKEHPNLRELISSDSDYIRMDPFTKKAEFYTFDSDCDYGCYLLLNVKSDVLAHDVAINRNYPYSIIVHSHPTSGTYLDIPSIKIQVDEYVIGTVDTNEETNRLFQFYIVSLNEDAQDIIIDLQSDAGGMFIKVGNDKPTTHDYDYAIPPQGKDTIHRISKEELLKNRSERSLKNLVLTIGIGTNTSDTVYTTLFAFNIRLGNGNTKDIYRVNSDQKALCKTKRFSENAFRCLYVIEYDYISDFNNLFIYTSVQKKSAFFNLYADYINHLDYETKNFEQLKIPTKGNSKFSSKDLSADYLYISEGLGAGNYLLVSVETDKETTVELMSTFCSFLNGVTPNPATPQLFMAITNYTFALNFPSENMVMVNLRGIGGSAEIHWENDTDHKYYLKGRDDRLAITSDKSQAGHKLLITATSNIQDGNGFVFYVTFSIRIDEANFDPLTLDRSVNYIYSDSDLPITYYAPVDYNSLSSNDTYDIFFSFSLLENEVEKKLTYYENIPFIITGYIVSESTIYDAKLTPDLTIVSQNKRYGFYDQALRTGLISIDQGFIQKSDVKGRKYLYIKIEKSNEFKDVRKYKRVNVETTIIQSSSNVSVTELSYQFGLLIKNQAYREYLLRTDSAFRYILLQFSSSRESIMVKLKEKTFSLKEISNKYGKKIYLIDTNLNSNEKKPNTISILVTRDSDKNSQGHFMFQYINTNNTNYPYSISNTAIIVKKKANQNKMDYKIELSPVDNYKNYENITYIVRLRNSTFRGKADLTLRSDRGQSIKEFYNPKVVNGKITLEITNCIKARYIQIIAQIRNKEAVEYLSYDISQQIEDISKGNAGFIILVIIGIALLSVVISLVIVIIIFNNKNKSLLDKVNQVSFAEDTKDDDLLISADKIN